ncbi:MAG: efflux RND transporter permease subunit [Planctomycetota bacterium]
MILPELAVKRSVATLMLFLALAVLAGVAVTRLPVDLFPQIEPPAISVITFYPGASAEDVESKATRHVENELSIVNNLDEIRSTSKENLSIVTCKFNWTADLNEAANDIRDRLEFAKPKLPEDADAPVIFKFNTSMFPVLVYGVSAKEHWGDLHRIVDKQVAGPLKRVPGVGAVSVVGGLERQINVVLDREKLEAYDVSPEDIERVLVAENMTMPAGSIKVGRSEYTLRVPGEFRSAREVSEIVLKRVDGRIVYLSDVARVKDSFKEQSMRVVADGANALIFFVQKQSGANTVRVVERVEAAIERIARRLPADVAITELQNEADFINWSVSNLAYSAILGGILVIVITIVFLRRPASSFIIAVTIPLSVLAALLLMQLLGYTINIMSLFALAMAAGMVVDNSIVILENISRHREMGRDPSEAATYGASEVGLAVGASTLTTVVIFIPLLFLTGIVGVLFKQLGVVFSAALIASLFTSLLLTPMLCSKFFKERSYRAATPVGRALFARGERALGRLEDGYRHLIERALSRKPLVILAALLSMGLALLAARSVGSEFFPEEDVGNIRVTVELPVETRVEESDRFAENLDRIFRQIAGADLEHVFYRTGTSEEGFSTVMGGKEGSNVIELTLRLVRPGERDRSTREIAREISERVRSLSGVVKLQVNPGNPMAEMVLTGERPISVEIIGHDLAKTDALAETVRGILAETPGTMDVVVSRSPGKPELRLEIDRAKASDLGLNVAAVGRTLRTYFYGRTASEFKEGGDEYDIFLRLREDQRSGFSDISAVTVENALGQPIPLANFAKVRETQGPSEIQRLNQERLVTVGCAVYGRSQGEVTADLRERLMEVAIPAGVELRFGGLVKEQQEAFTGLVLMLAVGVALVYMVMASQFESLLHPFVIMFSVPFAFVGVAFALYLFGHALSVVSFIGIIMLVGIVVNNAIVLVDYTNTLRRRGLGIPTEAASQPLPNVLRARGMELEEAVKEACRRRLRPVLMTTLTTIFGMLPLALATGEGSEVMRPLGTTVIGGLAVSTLVTLVLVPVVYTIFEGSRRGGSQSP